MIEILMIKFFFENVQIKKADDLDMALKKVNSSISKKCWKIIAGIKNY